MNSKEMKRGFLIMPFRDDLDWLRDEIVWAGTDEGVTIERADDIFTRGAILKQIFKAIDAADVVISVCTGKSANVFFELGYAWRHHNPILIAESSEDMPFDIQAFRTEFYGGPGTGQHRNTLKSRLRKSIAAALAEERLPQGRILAAPPSPKRVARLTARLQDLGRSHRLVISNSGTVEIHNVTVEVPQEAVNFRLFSNDLPLTVLRPGEQVGLQVVIVMAGEGRSIFDISLRGETAEGEPLEFPAKISI